VLLLLLLLAVWELLTCERPFRGLLEGDLMLGVCDHGLRPQFPPGSPAPYVALAQQCWAQDPAHRPTAAQVVKQLNELLYEERRARLKGTAAAAAAARRGDGAGAQGSSRQRRHSTPVGGKRRRRSRRFSLFVLPFTRQPAVPEDAPYDEQRDAAWQHSSGSQPAHARQQQQARPQAHPQPQPQLAGCSGAAAAASARWLSVSEDGVAASPGGGGDLACRSCGNPVMLVPPSGRSRRSSSASTAGSSVVFHSATSAAFSGHAPAPAPAHSSGSNVVVSTGGLLARARALPPTSESGTVHTAPASATAAAAGGPAAAGAAAASDGPEWFQSF
jgi:hypothetical protein